MNEMIKFSRHLDEARKLIVEYWADGPASELPPGHWGLFAQFVSRRDQHTIDQDVKMFFAMHNASFDAGIVAWHFKRKYDGVRPITAIRYRSRGRPIRAWGGRARPTENIPGEQWMPYNPGTNLTPPFPGYFSGHSVFSRSSATVLDLFTGSDYFGFSTIIPQCDPAYFGVDFLRCFGRVEPGIPSVDNDDLVRDIQRRRRSGGTVASVRRDPFQRRQYDRAGGGTPHRSAGLDQGADVLERHGAVTPGEPAQCRSLTSARDPTIRRGPRRPCARSDRSPAAS